TRAPSPAPRSATRSSTTTSTPPGWSSMRSSPPSPTGSASVASNVSERSGLPRIGLPTYVEPAQWGPWDRPAALLPRSYVDAVTAAGGLPVMLPPVDVPGAAEAAVDALDALVLTGGADIGDRAD